jgi:hypothetical protein
VCALYGLVKRKCRTAAEKPPHDPPKYWMVIFGQAWNTSKDVLVEFLTWKWDYTMYASCVSHFFVL